MKADKEFPVSSETNLSLSCSEGRELKGDETVTCIKNTEFQFSVEPTCSKYRIFFKNTLIKILNLYIITSHNSK